MQLNVGEPAAEGHADQRASRGEHDVRTGPQILVDGKPVAPDFSSGHPCDARGEHAHNLLLGGALRLQPLSGQDSAECTGDGRYGAEQSLGITRLLPHMSEHQLAVQMRGKVEVGVQQRNVDGRYSMTGHGDEPHDRPVADRESSNPDYSRPRA